MSKRNSLLFAALVLLLQVCSHAQNVGVGTPQIVARVNLAGQTVPISPTTLFVPAKDGTYRISAIMVITTANNPAGFWTVNLGLSPDTGPATFPLLPVNTSQLGLASAPDIPFRSDAGQPITYSVVDSGGAQGSIYELFLVLELL